MSRRPARGSRVLIRPLSAVDEREFLERVRESRRLHRPWSYPPETPEAFRAHLARYQDAAARGFAVCRRSDGAIVGWFGLSQIFHGSFRNAFLGYYAFEPFAGRGYMREGLDLVLRHAFGELRLHRVQASIQPANTRSIALVRGAGFLKEGYGRRYLKIGGRWRDHEHWVVLADDPPARRTT